MATIYVFGCSRLLVPTDDLLLFVIKIRSKGELHYFAVI